MHHYLTANRVLFPDFDSGALPARRANKHLLHRSAPHAPPHRTASMSDYGDEYSDYEEDWFYVEEEYMVADDLAEHAVQSPPPVAYDEDLEPEWDRFEYFNDLEYASDGYDNAAFEPHQNGKASSKTSRKRKRGTPTNGDRKKQRLEGEAASKDSSVMLTHTPIVWRSQNERGAKPRFLAENAETYALLKDWRERMADAPQWARKSTRLATPGPSSPEATKAQPVAEPGSLSAGSESAAENGGGAGIDPGALMAALQNNLAAAGGPLSGMDPQQLLQFVMRMAADEDAGDDIAGEMVDQMLNQGDDEEEDDEETEINLLSWVAQQRNKNASAHGDSSGMLSTPESPDASRRSKRLPTPPSSEANRTVRIIKEAMENAGPGAKNATTLRESPSLEQPSRKRKAEDASLAETSESATKRRVMGSCDAPTTASKAKAVSSKPRRTDHVER